MSVLGFAMGACLLLALLKLVVKPKLDGAALMGVAMFLSVLYGSELQTGGAFSAQAIWSGTLVGGGAGGLLAIVVLLFGNPYGRKREPPREGQ